MLPLQHSEPIRNNTGGLVHFLFAPAEALAYDPRPRRDVVNQLIVQAIPLYEGYNWQMATVLDYSLSYRERARLRREGTSYRQQLQGTIAKITPHLLLFFSNLRTKNGC